MSFEKLEVILYSPCISSRLRYITELIGNELLGKEFTLTNKVDVYLNNDAIKINYSSSRLIENEVWIKPHKLLFEQKIESIELDIFLSKGNKSFFKTEGDYPFDLFAASFYLVSRYEEYLPHKADMYGRFSVESSVAFKNNFLELPLVNIWLFDFIQFLETKYSFFWTIQKKFKFIPTYDIDEAYSFKHKSWVRTTGGIAKSIIKGNISQIINRILVLIGKRRDPFESYEWMNSLHKDYQLQPRYFFLVSAKLSEYDRNILPKKTIIKKLIKDHAKNYKIGLHPSWQSGDIPSLIVKEKSTIENIIQKKIHSSRQHFIRFSLPETYRGLMESGIREEFSMGYGTRNGFRASIADPFYWFDLEKNETTDLLVYPFCFMDANSFFEEKQTPKQALDEMLYYYNTVKAVNGCLITIWHNTFLGTDFLFKGWRKAYFTFIRHVFDSVKTPIHEN